MLYTLYIYIYIAIYIYIYIYMLYYVLYMDCSPSSCEDLERHLCACFRRVKDYNSLLRYSPILNRTYVRQVVLDKW